MKKNIHIGLWIIALACFSIAATADTFFKVRAGGSIEFEGATKDDFETTLTVADPTSDNIQTLQDGTGTLAFLSDITGGGDISSAACLTTDVFPVADGAKSISTAASILRQLCGDIIFDNGCADVTFNFSTVLCPIMLDFANVSGVPMIDNGITNNALIKGTATNGEAVNSIVTEIPCGGSSPCEDRIDINGCITLTGIDQRINAFGIFRPSCSGTSHKLLAATQTFSIGCTIYMTLSTTRLDVEHEIRAPSINADEFFFANGQTADPSDPVVVDAFKQWLSDGTATGSNGDIILKVRDSGGTTRISKDSLFRKQAVTITADDTVIVIEPNTNYLEIDSDSATATDRSFRMSAAEAFEGQRMEMQFVDATNQAEILSGSTNTKTIGGATITFNADGQVILWVFDGTDWVQFTPIQTSS